MTTPTLDIQHDTARSRFFAVVDGLQCEVDYQLTGTRMSVNHTRVPAQLEGRGIAAALVKHTLEWARSQDLQVVPVCSYVIAYLQRHPEYQSLTAPRMAG